MTTLSQAASTSIANSSTITVPATIKPFDLLVLCDHGHASGSTIPADVTPSGFTQITTTTLSATLAGRLSSSYKIADSTDISRVLTGIATSAGTVVADKILYVFRADGRITAVSPQSIAGQGTAGDPTAQVVTASGGTVPLLVFGAYGADSFVNITPRTFTPTQDNEIGTGFGANNTYFLNKIYNASPADTTIDMVDHGSINLLHSFYLNITADTPSPPFPYPSTQQQMRCR